MNPYEKVELLKNRLKEKKHSPIEENLIQQNIIFWENECNKINELNVYKFTTL